MPRTKETFEAMRENTRKKIATAAIALFARNGLSVTVDMIQNQHVGINSFMFMVQGQHPEVY